jgi:hypothetical protein
MNLVKAGQSARATFLILGLDGAPITGLTHGTGWQAKYSLNGGAATSISSGNGGEVGNGVYYATLTTSTAGDKIDFWATYTSSSTSLTAPGERVLVVDYDPKTVDKTGYQLAASQPNYAPAKAGDAMTLTSAYDAAKTAAAPGAKMDLVDNPNAAAVSSIQVGLATSSGLTSLQTHGDSTWATATGFSTFNSASDKVQLAASQPSYAPLLASGYTAPDNTSITAIKAKTDLIATNIADSPNAVTAQTNAASAATTATTIATILSGITSLPKWLRALFRKSTPDATALGEINSGGGTYDATTDSAEAMAEAIAAVDAIAGSAPTATEIWTHAQRSLTDGAIRVVSPFQSGSFAIVRGDSYLNADGNARSFGKVDGATWPTDLTGWTITFTCNPTDDLLAADPDAIGFTATGTVVTATGDSQAVRIDFTAAQTATLSVEDGGYKYDVQASSGNSRATLETGFMAVLEDQTTG